MDTHASDARTDRPPLPLIPVSDPDDPRIADYRDVRERDLVGRRGQFMAEGEVVLRLLASRGGADLVSVLVSQASLPRISDALDQLPRHVPIHVAAQPVMDGIVGFHIHRGILAIGRARPQLPPETLLAGLPARALVVALMGIANHDNMGGIFRNAAAFGAHAVLLDEACCDPLYRKAIRVSVGASLIVPTARAGNARDMLGAIRGAGFELLSLSPSGTERLSDIAPGGRMAALFGTEGPGLPPEVLAATRTVSIPMAPGFDSLNVATTSGIVLHHLAGGG
ncbi:RNA methyltransferase [Azorhizobium oxalatiphilum]|uniref:RNA methyltransferase n=1 Tax=Azorhizobium oxalatiphilum TaxID=980631 RepID=A0A917FIM1_9HYPH|nr:RNA methyltransferase [Azorhizobium oxalatiphilum]GGF81310.1 RNA methyltransferase [Azorhizobium oxalatiphilum]